MKKVLVGAIFIMTVVIALGISWGKLFKRGYTQDECGVELAKRDKRGGDICPKCQSKNVANIVYGYPAKGWGALAEDKKSYFHGCVLPKNPKEYHCNDCKYEWGGF